MDKIKNVLEKPLLEMEMEIDSISFENNELNIILDSTNNVILNIDKIVDATKVISKLLDEHDFIKGSYMLDVSSKEKGVINNEE